MPTRIINKAVSTLESRLESLEVLLDQSISNNEILAKTKIILRELREVSKELQELRKLNGLDGN